LQGFLKALVVFGFLPVLINLYLQGALGEKAIALIALGLLLFSILARKLMRFILPVACYLFLSERLQVQMHAHLEDCYPIF
jgi:hypothetical protein